MSERAICGALSDYLVSGGLMCRLPSGHEGRHRFTPPDARLASEDAREPLTPDEFAKQRASDWRVPATRAAYDVYLREFEAALPSPSGPDAETLAAPLDWHGEGDPLPLLAESLERSLRDALDDMCRPLTTAYEREIARLAAVEALSGLVALVEQRERERDEAIKDRDYARRDQVRVRAVNFSRCEERDAARAALVDAEKALTKWETAVGEINTFPPDVRRSLKHARDVLAETPGGGSSEWERAEKAEALLARCRRALEAAIGDINAIARDNQRQSRHARAVMAGGRIRTALAASAPGTEEP